MSAIVTADDDLISVRIIVSGDCHRCQRYKRIMSLAAEAGKLPFGIEFYDGDAPENQSQLDEWGINDMPVVQLISVKGEVLTQLPPGEYRPRGIEYQIAKVMEADDDY